MNLGNVRTAVALTSTLEALPDETNVLVEFEVQGFRGEMITVARSLQHMRSTADGKAVVFSTKDMPDES
jgi:hypothetical protein